ncbi:MAG TPA: hypothetical protein VKQ72_10275 [Aggregatilineales bacterium]|nr:hypothetical protein [Aggregatilineales bacterium]
MIQIVMAILGVIALIKGNIKITNNRQVSGNGGRILGIVLLLGAAAPLIFADLGLFIMLGAFVVAIVIGLASSEPVAKPA